MPILRKRKGDEIGQLSSNQLKSNYKGETARNLRSKTRHKTSNKKFSKYVSESEVSDTSDVKSDTDSDFEPSSKDVRRKFKNTEVNSRNESSSDSEPDFKVVAKKKVKGSTAAAFEPEILNVKQWNNLSESDSSDGENDDGVCSEKSVKQCVVNDLSHVHSFGKDDGVYCSEGVKVDKSEISRLSGTSIESKNVNNCDAGTYSDANLLKEKTSKPRQDLDVTESAIVSSKRNLRKRKIESVKADAKSEDSLKISLKTKEKTSKPRQDLGVTESATVSSKRNLRKRKIESVKADAKSEDSLKISLKTNNNEKEVTNCARTPKKSNESKRERIKEDTDESDWEEVKDGISLDDYNPIIPKDGVNVMIDLPDELRKKMKKKKSNDELLMDYCRLLRGRIIKENHFNLHKTHLLSLIALGFHISDVVSSDIIKGLVMSCVPLEIGSASYKNLDLKAIDKLMSWHLTNFSLSGKDDVSSVRNSIVEAFHYRTTSVRNFVVIFAAVLRYLGIDCRLVFSLRPIPIKDFKKARNPFLLTGPRSYFKLEVKDGVSDHTVHPKTGTEAEGSDKQKSEVLKVGRKKKRQRAYDDVNCTSGADDVDSDFSEAKSFKSKKKSPKRRGSSSPVRKTVDVWLEVYVPSEKRWITVECINGNVDKEDLVEKTCSQPIMYVLAFNGKRSVKDVTERYASGWLNRTQKLRVDWYCGSDWWKDTLAPYKMKGKKNLEENKQLQKKSLDLPLPASIAEYKHHKLYALTRHLLKFEAIYPPDAPPLGFIRSEPIYARECVRTLYSRDHWVQQARTVKTGETPYKIVKARPKFKKSADDENRMLELFGFWQTEKYDPPAAVDGKVPRNAYGNVELFKSEMLPKGTRHLTDMPGLVRVAKKIEIDCAAAMIGWDFRKGRNVPMLDGWIVCEEHVDALMLAWDDEQETIRKRDEQKREKRIYGNWKKLINGLLIKEKIQRKYGVKS